MKRLGGAVGWWWLFQRRPLPLPLPSARVVRSLSVARTTLPPHPQPPLFPGGVCTCVCARRWYNDGVAGDDSLMRLNINSHFVDASPPLFRDFFPSRDSRSRLPDEHRR